MFHHNFEWALSAMVLHSTAYPEVTSSKRSNHQKPANISDTQTPKLQTSQELLTLVELFAEKSQPFRKKTLSSSLEKKADPMAQLRSSSSFLLRPHL